MSNEKIRAIIFIALFFLIAIYITHRKGVDISEIKNNPAWAVGHVENVIDVGGKYPGSSIYYSYRVADSMYLSHFNYNGLIKGNADAFLGKYFPVIYSEKDISNSKLLLNRHDFDIFFIQFPDSLQWVEKYFR